MVESMTFCELNSKNRIAAAGFEKKERQKEEEVAVVEWLTSVSSSGLLVHEVGHLPGQLCVALKSTGMLKLQAPS